MLLNCRKFLSQFLLVAVIAIGGLAGSAQAQVTAFKQAIAETASKNKDVAAFYRSNDFNPIWTKNTSEQKARRRALIAALSSADDHGLPAARYDVKGLKARMAKAKTARDLGVMDVELSKVFLRYARDVQTGVLVPSRVDEMIVRKVPYRAASDYFEAVQGKRPSNLFKSLPPQSAEYARLMKEKLKLEKIIAKGGWGATVPGKKYEPGDSGNGVTALRNRLVRMGYLRRSATKTFDVSIQKAVQNFQLAHGLSADGVAGTGTLKEINHPVEKRLQSVIVAMERERWMNRALGKRHVMVNLADFHARIIDNGKVTFETRSVVGKNQHDRRSPEFSDEMEHMVINPTWNVPRSIATKEYLPQLQKNPGAVGYLRLVDASGRTVARENVDFNQYTARTFPFNLKQAPSNSNALGLVKFMFPNKHNIYLHDTPQKALFGRESRAFSHGCIRLQKPFEFAYALLAKQESNPKSFFHAKLKTGKETQVNLKQKVPVHIMYRTALTTAKGELQFRRDVYGRDAKIWKALSNEGVVLRAVRG